MFPSFMALLREQRRRLDSVATHAQAQAKKIEAINIKARTPFSVLNGTARFFLCID